VAFTSLDHVREALARPEIRYATRLSLISCTLSAMMAVLIAIPTGYLLSRFPFPGRNLVDAFLDIPIVLPPLVVGLALLILFQTPWGQAVERQVPVTFAVPSVVLAQFTVAAAFAVRTMRVAFDQLGPRREDVALTLGATRGQAFWWVALPEARRGVVTSLILSWARSMGEFGPVLIFSGATRFRTEVLPTTVFLEMNTGRVEAAAAVSLLMILVAMAVLLLARVFGLRGGGLL
jgi:molybdate transport system permease protein